MLQREKERYGHYDVALVDVELQYGSKKERFCDFGGHIGTFIFVRGERGIHHHVRERGGVRYYVYHVSIPILYKVSHKNTNLL